MTGKEKCRILKDIRRQIAQENDIRLVIEECTHKGECRGTCPRCESELRYLETELEKRRSLKKKIALAGISAGVMLSLSGCKVLDMIAPDLPDTVGLLPKPTEDILMGDIQIMGEEVYQPEETELPFPMGTMPPGEMP
ncbi:MAG: hypothetical protein IJA26_03125 [Clostridia bacterium]|nr:hypothetical protein [Clostridia bacterium]